MTRNVAVAVLLLSLLLGLPDLSPGERRAGMGLALLLAAGAASLWRRPSGPGGLHRGLLLGAVLFLAAQPFSAPREALGRIPARPLLLLGVALALWVHMNVQSVSGRLAWRFSRVDVAALGACGLVVLGSLGLLWHLSDPEQVLPSGMLIALSVTCGVLYLYVSRWRPGRGACAAALLALAAMLVAGAWSGS